MIPPSKPPASTTLYGPPTHQTRSQTSSTSSNRFNSTESDTGGTGPATDGVVNKGWNFLSDVFTVTSTFKSSTGSKTPTRARSRDYLPVHLNNNYSLDIPTIKTR